MKKLITLLLALVLVLSFVACGETTNESKAEEADSTVLADTEHELWVAHGQYQLADGTQNGWNGKDAELYEKSKLTAISMKDVQDLNADLYAALKGKEVKYLYTIDLIFGVNDAGWTSKFLKDGKIYEANGSYAFKIAQCTSEVDGETKVYSEAQWISDPKTAYAEALTPATVFYPTWQEEKDENGFAWNDNPVVIGGAGLYTLVVAQYKNASEAGKPGYGVGLILKEAKEGIAYTEAQAVEPEESKEETAFVPADHTYGIVGSFEASGWADGKDIAMTAGEDNTWTGEVELKANDEFKVRADGAWDLNWGGNGANGDNIKVEADGTYVVTLTFDAEGNGTVTYAAK